MMMIFDEELSRGIASYIKVSALIFQLRFLVLYLLFTIILSARTTAITPTYYNHRLGRCSRLILRLDQTGAAQESCKQVNTFSFIKMTKLSINVDTFSGFINRYIFQRHLSTVKKF